jgi:membrane-associated phospholipid phosphatase
MQIIRLGLIISAAVALMLATSPNSMAGDHYISKKETVVISGATALLFTAGHFVKKIDSTRSPLIHGPLPLEESLQHTLGGDYHPGKRNFLDSHTASAYTPVAFGVFLTAADLRWPKGDRFKTTLQDGFLFTAGLLATKGITDLAKGITARPRPKIALESDSQTQNASADFADNHHSFFSGHASSAFFAATYLNKRVRSIMRTRLDEHEYRRWRWFPPIILFGWSTYVGWSRIQAYEHYVSDVIVGAAVGYLTAELYYSYAGVPHFGARLADNGATQLLITFNF